jgi:hypothetical protein
MRHIRLLSSASLFAWLGLGAIAACDAPSNPTADPGEAALAACHLDDGTVDVNADLHACDPGSVKKTTICHIPPGNPANAHTICVGNAAVPAHLQNHGDSVGPCKVEKPCPPPPTGSGGATGGGAGGASGGGSGGAAGADAGITIVP